ncbi:MarR family transcriptional regulator [Steroidobacter flavus]|uniref:MarR family transcriptional regulator n=1 Tax=Steroidobacter flavus TaxID=1842136 RepID=A0ABV8SS16_9GAMM
MLDEVLFGKTRAALLRELYTNPDRRLSFNELVRRLKSGPGAVSRELATLTAAGLVVEQREGHQRFLSAATSSPVFTELKNFIAKSSGASTFIRDALRGLEDKIDIALIFGSVAKGTERADSDLDFFVIGTVGYSVITERIYSIEDRLGRRVQTLYFDPDSPTDRASLMKPSMHAMLAGPKVFVLGDEAKLASLISVEEGDGKKGKPRQSNKRRETRTSRR